MSNTINYEGILSYVDKYGTVHQLFPWVKSDKTLKDPNIPANSAAVGENIVALENNLRPLINAAQSSADAAMNVAKGRNQAVVYETYSDMVEALSVMDKETLKVGYNIYIATPWVPDLWVYSVEENNVSYSINTSTPFIDETDNHVLSSSEAGVELLKDNAYYSEKVVGVIESGLPHIDENGKCVLAYSEAGIDLLTDSETYSIIEIIYHRYADNEILAEDIKKNVTVQIGHYKIAQLETQKVDLTPVDAKLKELEERMKTMTTYEWDDKTQTLNIITT